jgi:isoleucyl-tRNA synthetase
MTDQPDYKSTVFLPVTDFPMKAGLAQKEPAIAARWAAMDLYGKLREKRAGRERFILHDGPPYANGDIHMGHAMNKVLKDIIVRSQSLLGKDAPYVPGWDCHGLPIEWKIEEEYRKKKLNKDEVPAAEFRAQCRAYADKWVDVQKEQFKRLGVMGDWADPYLTMKFDAEATIVGELLKFAESGQLYRGAKPVMWSPVEKTALAEAEVEYEDITSTQIDVAFEIVEAPNAPELLGAHAVRNGWAGVVIDGCVRDVAELAQCAVGIRALALVPMPTQRRVVGQTQIAVQIQGVWVHPGDWLYADEDGMVVSAQPL